MIGDSVKHKKKRSSPISPELQLLIAVRYYATETCQVFLFIYLL